MRSVELFTGAGGMALGIERAGFAHEHVIERDKYCCDTIRENQRRGVPLVAGWKLFPGDVRKFDYSEVTGPVDLLAGGPPCQPFSIGGKHKGYNDKRDMFPQMVKAVRKLQPRAILIENVKGLLRKSFAEYLEYVILQLSHPELVRKDDEDWTDHLARLEQHHTTGKVRGLEYRVLFRHPINAANYGIPQRRERILLVGFRADLGVEWSFPKRTHSADALLRDQWITGEYWDRHEVAKKHRPPLPDRLKSRIEELRAEPDLFERTLPWRTVRDAISNLPDPEFDKAASGFLNHEHNPGARSYVGHTGSPLDEPAKTLKAGDHGVPGGENTVLYPDGRLRYFTVRESARLQTFPDDYLFHGSWTETMRQLGNAVPVELAETVSGTIRQSLQRLG